MRSAAVTISVARAGRDSRSGFENLGFSGEVGVGILRGMSGEGAAAVDVFVSYSHADEELRSVLETHLAALRRQGSVRIWHDRKITAGTEWAGEIDRNLTSAQVVLLLVSPEFIASDYCWDKEMIRALERHRAGKARVVPIILRPCDWQSSPLGELQALPRGGKPVTRWADRDEGFLDVVRGIRVVIEELRVETLTLVGKEREPGEEWLNEKDGSVLVYVPGSEYVLGAEDIADSLKPVHFVKLSAFWIGKHTVTNAQFSRFLDANSKYQRPAQWDDRRFNDPQQPVVGVSWTDALAYCEWAGLGLPTEAQWEAAARGKDLRPYPWGKHEPTAQLAKFGEDPETGRPAPVGSFPLGAGPFGTLDQAGNVWEWCFDELGHRAHHRQGTDENSVSPASNRDPNAEHMVRGGSWNYPASFLRAAIRSWYPAEVRLRFLGFRVALGAGAEPRN